MATKNRTKKVTSTIPASERANVAVYRAARNAVGVRLTMTEAWQELQSRALARDAKRAQEHSEAQERRKAARAALFNGDAADELSVRVERLAGVRDILDVLINCGVQYGDAAGLARDAVDEIAQYLAQLSGLLKQRGHD